MSNIGRWVIWGLLPSLIAGLFLNTVVPFDSISSDVFNVVLTDPILRVETLTVIIVAPMYFGMSYIIGLVQSLIDRRRDIKKATLRVSTVAHQNRVS